MASINIRIDDDLKARAYHELEKARRHPFRADASGLAVRGGTRPVAFQTRLDERG